MRDGKESGPFDVFFLLGAGIGNVLQALYAVEHCLMAGVSRVGVYVHKTNRSFVKYLKDCYGDVVVDRPEVVHCRHLIHSFCVEETIPVAHDNYFYVKPDFHSCHYHSETEQYLSVVRALFPSDRRSDTLTLLREDCSSRVDDVAPARKTVLYPGGSSLVSARRWPHFAELIGKLGAARVLIVGSRDDFEFSFSYVYPQWFARMAPQPVLNRKGIWRALKRLGLLRKHAHLDSFLGEPYVFLDHFSWPELVAIFRRCKQFVGNDGGLTHLAAACGASGVVLFGPTSEGKNRPMNPRIRTLARRMPCEPCQFGVGTVQLTKSFINCPLGVKCLRDIPATEVFGALPCGERRS